MPTATAKPRRVQSDQCQGFALPAEPGWAMGLHRHGQRLQPGRGHIIQRSRSPCPFTPERYLVGRVADAPENGQRPPDGSLGTSRMPAVERGAHGRTPPDA